MDLRDLSWEKKALIGLGVITVIILVFAYSAITSPPTLNNTANNYSYTAVSPQPVPVNPQVNDSGSNNTTENTNITITKEQAKQIAEEPGYTVGEPKLEDVSVNNQSVQVWNVPLYKDNRLQKEVYVDTTTGNIVATRTYTT